MIMHRFRPTLWGTVAALGGFAAALGLGYWQLDRAEQKLMRAAEHAELARKPALRLGQEPLPKGESIELRRVEARGRFVPEAIVLIDNRVRRGAVGYEVVMPLRLATDQSLVLVNRGWTPGTGDRRRLPEISTPNENVLVIGTAVIPGKRMYELGAEIAEGQVWQNLSIERFRSRMNLPILPIVVQQTNHLADGLLREWPALDYGVNTHHSYALQWFALAVLVAVVYLVLSFRRVPSDA